MSNKMDSDKILLDIVLPTYNNPACVKYILDKLETYSDRNYNFVLSIYDSSTDEETKNLVKPYLSSRVLYHYIDSKVNVDEKTLIAVKNSEAEYVFLIADGYCPKLDEIFREIDFEKNRSEIIVLYDRDWKPQRKYYEHLKDFDFTDKNEFFRLHFWQLILYGGSICKNALISEINLPETVSAFIGSGFIYPAALATYSVGPYESKIGNFLELVPYKGASGWIKNKTAIKTWTENLYNALNKLDGVLGRDCIDNIIKTTGKNTGFLTANGLASFKCNGNFSYAIYKKYKYYLKRCKACSSFFVLFAAICPRFLFVIARKFKRALRLRGHK